jgi:hypothetical protein
MNLSDLTLDISQEIRINAAKEGVFRSLLRRLADENAMPDGESLSLVLEPWPGGRWFRDLGDRQGHLWGFVQVIKPPTLLEIAGPLIMSYPAAGHIQFRLTPVGGGTNLALRHRVLGMIDADRRAGIASGWERTLMGVKESSEG